MHVIPYSSVLDLKGANCGEDWFFSRWAWPAISVLSRLRNLSLSPSWQSQILRFSQIESEWIRYLEDQNRNLVTWDIIGIGFWSSSVKPLFAVGTAFCQWKCCKAGTFRCGNGKMPHGTVWTVPRPKHNGLGGASYCEVKSGAVISLNNPKWCSNIMIPEADLKKTHKHTLPAESWSFQSDQSTSTSKCGNLT